MQTPNEKQCQNAIDGKAIGFYTIAIKDFLRLTTDRILYEELTKSEPHQLSSNYWIFPYLNFDCKTGRVEGHEGRHRAANMLLNGEKDMLIALYPYPKHREWNYDLSELPTKLKGELVPSFEVNLDKGKIDRILQNITGYDANSGEKFTAKLKKLTTAQLV